MDRLNTLIAFLMTVVLCANIVRGERKAVCKVVAGSGNGTVSGTIEFSQPASGTNVTMKINLQGFNATSTNRHGFHVHATASLGNKCLDAGGHLNIDKTLHGAPTDSRQNRHTGDFGNIDVNENGVVSTTISDWLISLHDEPTSVIGKPIVVHEGEDDLGRGGQASSNTTGNAGARLGCCLIELTYTSSGSTISTLSAWSALMLALFVVIRQDVYSRIN